MSDTEFEKAVENVKNLNKTPEDSELLQIYGLYKQATCGDVTTTRPSFYELKAKAKWDAWNALKGKSTEEAKTAYIELVNKLISTYGLK